MNTSFAEILNKIKVVSKHSTFLEFFMQLYLSEISALDCDGSHLWSEAGKEIRTSCGSEAINFRKFFVDSRVRELADKGCQSRAVTCIKFEDGGCGLFCMI